MNYKKILSVILSILMCSTNISSVLSADTQNLSKTELTNVAVGKPVTSNRGHNSLWPLSNLTDGFLGSVIVSEYTDNSEECEEIVIDLLRKYRVEKIEIYDRYDNVDQAGARVNFEIFGLNDENSEEVLIGKNTDPEKFLLNEAFVIDEKNSENNVLDGKNAFRYIKLKRTNKDYFGYSEIKVYAKQTATLVTEGKSVKATVDNDYYRENFGPEKAIDGINVDELNTCWIGGESNIAKYYPYWQIDLGEPMHIGMIEMEGRTFAEHNTNENNHRKYVNVYGSNTTSDSEYYEALAELPEDTYKKLIGITENQEVGGEQVFPKKVYQNTDGTDFLKMTVDDREAFQYLTYKKTYHLVGTLGEFRAYVINPEILDISLENNAVKISFSDEMDFNTINSESVYIKNTSTGERIACEISMLDNYSAAIDVSTLNRTTEYSVNIEDTVQNMKNVSLPSGYSGSVWDLTKLSAGEIKFFDNLGRNISDYRGLNQVNAQVSVLNGAETEKEVMLCLAHYDGDGRLRGVNADSRNIKNNSIASLNTSISGEFDARGTIKAFVFDNLEMKPVCDNGALKANLTEFYVSTDGDDLNRGSVEAPFATVQRAQEEVRCYNSDMQEDITVYLREGDYFQTETLSFNETDSGTNGYYVNYKAYPNENVNISGGIKISDWVQDDFMWCADVDGAEDIFGLSVNGRRAVPAQSEWIDIDTLFEDGICVENTKYAEYANQSDIRLRFIRGWKSYLLCVENIEAEESISRFTMRQPTFYFAEYNQDDAYGYEKHFYNIEDNNNFKIENAFEELDEQGEYYYNKNERKVYYIPRADEDMRSADVRGARVETLLEVSGESSAEKVSNLSFDGITFSDAAWKRASEYGFVVDQAQTLVFDPEIDAKNPGYTITPPNLYFDRAENIRFTNNVVKNMGAVGLGLVQGVDNSLFEGNVFCDIGDSAITVGSSEYVYEDEEYSGRNLAIGKSVSAGSVASEYYTPNRALDVNTGTLWAPEDYKPSWWQVDLEEAYEIDRVELDYRTDGVAQSFKNLQVLASNSSDFSEYSVLNTNGPISETDKGVVIPVENSEKFRYVRLKMKGDTEHWVLSEVRIINESMDYVKANDICDNNKFRNNYITRVGSVNTAAPGMQLYYVKDTEISNNYIKEVPYSGIAAGWGWGAWSDAGTSGGNSIINNRIESVMQESFDGGGIYITGVQAEPVVISGNYIRNVINGSGVYLDTATSNCNITSNVVEDTFECFCAGSETSGNVWRDNFAASVLTSIICAEENDFSEPTHFIMGNYPDAAAEIINNAGITEAYKGIIASAGENYDIKDVSDYYNNMRHDEDNEHILIDYVAKLYNKSLIMSARKWLELADDDYSAEAKQKLEKAVLDAEALYTDDVIPERDVIFDMCIVLRSAMYEFSESYGR